MRIGLRVQCVTAACVLASGCGGDPADARGGDTTGIDPGGSTGGESDLGDTGLGLDLGNADDGGVGGCGDEAPPGYAIDTDPDCKTEPQIGMFDPVIEWHKSEWANNGGSRNSVTTPIVIQLSDDDLDGSIDDDDVPDLVYVTYDNGGMLRAISGDGSAEVLSVSVPSFNRQTGISAADIDLDGIVEIVGIDSSSRVVVFEHDGTIKWTSVSLSAHMVEHDNTAAISDMDGDGWPEIVAGRAILDGAGNVIATGQHGKGSFGANGCLSFAVDLDGNGQQEVVVGNALYRMDGSAIWYNGESDGFPAVADLTGDGQPEIVVVNSGKVRLQSALDGSVLWSSNIPGGQGGPPTVEDFDGDGQAEIGVAGSSTYTVFEGDGTQLWSNVTQDYSSGITGSSVYDFEGDGIADVVYADERRLWVYSGHDGTAKLALEDHSSGTRIEYPIVADVDGDGQVEIAFVNEPHDGKGYRGLTVVGDANESWRPGRKIWNQHAYHITNVDDDGGIPTVADLNWKSYNNFRSGDISPPDGLATPDLELFGTEVCEGICNDGLRRVWIQVGNGGAAALTAGAQLEVYGVSGNTETFLEAIDFQDPLPAGQVSEGIGVWVDPSQYEAVRVYGTANELECKGATPPLVEIPVPPCDTPQG